MSRSARPLSSFLLGLLVLVLTVPAIAILAATVVGIAVVPFVLCALVVAGLIGKAGVMRATGRSVVTEDEEAGRLRAFASILIGFAVLTIAYMIPVLGFITWAITGSDAAYYSVNTLTGPRHAQRSITLPTAPAAFMRATVNASAFATFLANGE